MILISDLKQWFVQVLSCLFEQLSVDQLSGREEGNLLLHIKTEEF